MKSVIGFKLKVVRYVYWLLDIGFDLGLKVRLVWMTGIPEAELHPLFLDVSSTNHFFVNCSYYISPPT